MQYNIILVFIEYAVSGLLFVLNRSDGCVAVVAERIGVAQKRDDEGGRVIPFWKSASKYLCPWETGQMTGAERRDDDGRGRNV